MSLIDMQVVRALGSIPWMLVALGGIVWCMVNASRGPKVRLAVGIALGLQLARFFVLPLVMSNLGLLFGVGASATRARIFVDSVVYSIPDSIALGLLLWAAFSSPGREPNVVLADSGKRAPS
jgi:hypothetical protein